MFKYTIAGSEFPENEFYSILEDNYMKALVDHTTMVSLKTLKEQIANGITVVINNQIFKRVRG